MPEMGNRSGNLISCFSVGGDGPEVLTQELWTWILTYFQVKRCGLGPRQSRDLEPRIPYKASILQRLYPEGKCRGDTFSLHRETRKHTHLYLSFQWEKNKKDLEKYEPWPYTFYVCVPVKALQSCLILCDPLDYCPPGSYVYAILQVRILEWVAVSPSRESSWPRDWTCISYVSGIGRWVLYH